MFVCAVNYVVLKLSKIRGANQPIIAFTNDKNSFSFETTAEKKISNCKHNEQFSLHARTQVASNKIQNRIQIVNKTVCNIDEKDADIDLI